MAEQRAILNAFVDGRDLVQVYRKDDGRVYSSRKPAEFVSYVRGSEISDELRRELRTSSYVRGMRDEGSFVRLSWLNEDARRGMNQHPDSPLVRAGVTVYEGDVDPVRRHFTDADVVRIAKPRRCYLDIETDSRVPFSEKEKMRVLTWAVVCCESGSVQKGVLAEWSDAAERTLLEEMWAALDPFDQIVAWYGDGFDFPVIWARSAERQIRKDARRWLYLDHLEAYKRFNTASESGDEKRSMRLEDIGQSVTGRGKLKTPQFVIDRFGDKSMGALSYELWEAGGEFRQLLLDYNVQDTELLRDIERETGYLDLFGTLCEVCRLFPDTRSMNPTYQMDGFMLGLGRTRDYRFPTKRFKENGVKFKGAYVMQPTSLDETWRVEHGMHDGILRNVHVCDFSAMYPSIILTWNMSPDTKAQNGTVNGPIPDGTCRAPGTGVCFRTDVEGILPVALKELIRLRKHWNDLKASFPPGTPEWHDADRRSTAYKVAANAFYGVLGSPFSRYFDPTIGESVTQAGVWLLKRTIHEAERKLFLAVYGDTDSAFVTGPDRNAFAAFVQYCNEDLYPVILRELGCRENHIKLAYEKEFDRIVFCAAKKYIGSYRHYKWSTTCTCDVVGKKGKKQPGSVDVKTGRCRDCGVKHEVLPPIRSKPEIKGLEYKRGDALKMAADLQARCIDALVGGLDLVELTGPTTSLEHFHGELSRARQGVLEGPLALEDVKLSKAIGKPLKEYIVKAKLDGTAAAQPPHIVVAQELKKRGQDVREGTRIDYFVVDGDASPLKAAPAEDWAGECDRYYLWESLVYPPTQRLLESAFPGHDWAGWAKVRPPKTRKTKASRAAALQPELFTAPPAQPSTSIAAPKGKRRPKAAPEPLFVTLDEELVGATPQRALEAVRSALQSNPGPRPVQLVIRLASGARASLETGMSVEATPELLAFLATLTRHKGTGGRPNGEEAERSKDASVEF